MIAIALVVLAGAVAFAALRWLPGADWVYRSPRLGIAAWYAAVATVILSLVSAAAEAIVPMRTGVPAICTAVLWCVQAMGGAHGAEARVMANLVTVCIGVVVLVAAARVVRGGRAMTAQRRRHRDMVTLAGRRHAGLRLTLIDHPHPAAYVLPGHASRYVVTTGAVQHLSRAELTAVLAHERAHADGRHQLLLDTLGLLSLMAPRASMLRTAHAQVMRLVEIRADEVAAARHPRIDLARALVTMATPHAGPAGVPVGLVAGDGGDTAERLGRLLHPPRRLPLALVAGLTVAIAALPVVPLVMAAACRWYPALSSCVWSI
ncbi:M56 family metallopeptidase [Spirilliplanes yamanashiensis]|uniref:Membrane protein n=1 Tax=Spirilliplanes yamanashiensis TaxID=42233 RepID=A0A8J3YD61_9ACTN|nr:M56 family metallopeptidase [Spirilliplanes yamanashiensis]MDP9818380.1 beta-lactamase regulating signal transducer with metallopeptidase domain [Spirilliplanes yamanashiensis]GIJ06601.1 membrane protein [Spirilliplanes yamanashiensis]